MRWDNLTIAAEEQRRLPGYREEAVVRRFDAPEALHTRFYEVRARSVLNRVPEKSRMPFRWTINPYRGCSHACRYCIHGDTPILLASGRHKPVADVKPGDEIYGTVVGHGYRRYVRTTVTAQWSTVKPAYRVTLADGTELIASGDHRFLSNRGWTYVTNSDCGSDRAHLTLNSRLRGTGQFAEQPHETDDYRRGYLCGLIRGDGCPRMANRQRSDGTSVGRRARTSALVELEALIRARRYLFDEALVTDERLVRHAAAGSARTLSIGTSAGGGRIEQAASWPRLPSLDWCRGFLGGIFDAAGSRGAFALRIASHERETTGWTMMCLQRLGFKTALDGSERRDRPTHIRVIGGLAEQLRFFHCADPAVTRRRSIEGQVVRTSSDLRVAAIEPLGRLRLYDITTGTGDFVADGVVSHNCFARPTHEYLGFDAGRDFEREIVVKVNAPEVLRTELARPSWKREHIAMGTNTDPYQWVEGRYRLMQGIWEALRDAGNDCSILTKSPLLLRDLPLMLEVAQRARITASLSIPTLDEKAWRATEPHTPNPRARLEAVAELNRAGIPTGVLIAPLMPGINDSPRQLEPLLEAAEQAGATSIGGVALHLRGTVRDVFMEWLKDDRPELVARYERLYDGRAYAPERERKRLAALVRRGRVRFSDRPPSQADPPRWRGSGATSPEPEEAAATAREAHGQATLF